MKQIFLAPRSNETAYKNYISSMQGIPKATLGQYFDDEDKAVLQHIDTIHAWGCQPSLESRWANMQYGDYILFYARGKFVSIGELVFKKKSNDLALALWPRSKETNEPWTCVFFVDKLIQIDLPLSDFNEVTGYDLPAVMGFMPVRKGMEQITKRFGDIEGFVKSLKSGLDLSEIDELANITKKSLTTSQLEDVAKFDELTRGRNEAEIEEALRKHTASAHDVTPQKIIKVVSTFKRNRKLVSDMKEKYKNECQICGFTFKMANGSYYSEAAHIVPISSGRVGLDTPDNIWILCSNNHKMLDTKALKAISATQYKLNDQAYDLRKV
jgi:hypothetical protein